MSTILDALKKAKTEQEKNAGTAAGASPVSPPPPPSPLPPSPPAAAPPPPSNKTVSPYQPTSPPMPLRPLPAPENKVNPGAPISPVSLSEPLGRSAPWIGIVFGLLLAFGAGGTAMFFAFRNIERGGKAEKQPQISNLNQSNISNVDVEGEEIAGDSQQQVAAVMLSQSPPTQTHTAPPRQPRQSSQQSSAVRTSAPADTAHRESELSGLSDSTAVVGTGPRELARAPVADSPPRHIAPPAPSPAPVQASPALEETPVLQETPQPPPSPTPAAPTPTPAPTPVASPTPDDPLAAYADGSRVSAEELGWRLEGILWDPASPMVIIGGKFLNQGDKYEDFVIAEIRQSEIVVERSGKRLIVRY